MAACWRCCEKNKLSVSARITVRRQPIRTLRAIRHPICLDRIRERFDHSDFLIAVLEECLA
jgi:hypothetical protein